MRNLGKLSAALLAPVLLMLAPLASAGVVGVEQPAGGYNLTAKAAHIALGDGNSVLAWGYADDNNGGVMQYPGPTLIVEEGDIVTINLSNDLDDPVSIVFPGQTGVSTGGGDADGLLTRETDGTTTVTYTFTANQPGTYMYQSGTQPELQIEMGLVGAIIVRPGNFNEGNNDAIGAHGGRRAYRPQSTRYDREYLFFLSDMDRSAHEALDQGLAVDPATFAQTLWFINGRNGPDTLHPHQVPWLPNQPYGALAQMKPGERILMRIVSAGRDLHPFHHHGNNAWMIAKDGQILSSNGAGANADYPDYSPPNASLDPIPELQALVDNNYANLPNQAISNYTVQAVPGSTYDVIFTWTGIGLKWDIYGNRDGHNSATCVEAVREPYEDPNSHCKDMTVVLPEQQALTFGGFWTGSPYLGSDSALPPAEGGLNPNSGFSYMWHSHTERELTNDDIFPGGMMTMMIVEPGDACIADQPTDVCP